MKVIVIFHFCKTRKTLIKQRENKHFPNATKRCKIPYKTKGKWSFCEAKIEKGVQNHWKSITFFTITDMGFHQDEIPYKTNGNWWFWGSLFAQKSTFGTPADANLTEYKKGICGALVCVSHTGWCTQPTGGPRGTQKIKKIKIK